jgi:sec-independent protein translocase protein TatA
MGRLGPGEIALIAILALMLFGASRVSDVGRGLGEAIRNFKKSLTEDDDPPLAALPVAPPSPVVITTAPTAPEPPPG